MNPSPLRLTASLDLPRIARGTPTRVRVVAEVAADVDPTVASADRPPLAVLLALDTSGSMQGDKLRHLVRSVELVVDHLTPRDLVGVVCFANEARIAAPLASRAAWKPAVVAGLRADGGTNIAAGLDLAAHLFDAQVASARGAMVLLSDGQPNIGASSPTELGAIARSLRDRLSISTLGYGADHNDAVLASIAESGGGSYAFIPSPEQCRVELARVVGAQVDAVADRVTLRFEPAPGLTGAGELRLPDFCAGDRRIATFDLDVLAQPQLGAVALGRLVLSYRPAGGDAQTSAAALDIDVAERAAPRNAVAHALGLVRDGELARAEASRLVDAGRFADARHTLQCCLARIRDALAEAPSPQPAELAELAELAEQLVDDVALIDQRPDVTARAAYRRGQHAMSPQYASPMLARAYGPVPKATVIVLSGDRAGTPIALGREMTIGRTASADMQLPSGRVSRLHTRIVAADGAFWVNDLGSTDGTRLNGARITSHRLRDGDVIEIGDYRLLFRGE